jgi:hypothetical protein
MQTLRGFIKVLGPRPEGMTLDRIDNNGNYAPGNVRWATRLQQQNNTRTNHWITWRGKTQTLPQWARELGIQYGTLRFRLYVYNWPVEDAFTRGSFFRVTHFKLTNQQIVEISKSPDPCRILAVRFGISEKTAKSIKMGRTYGHITGLVSDHPSKLAL